MKRRYFRKIDAKYFEICYKLIKIINYKKLFIEVIFIVWQCEFHKNTRIKENHNHTFFDVNNEFFIRILKIFFIY